MSYFFQRRCASCEQIYDSTELISICRKCGHFLLMEYDLYKARQEGYSLRDMEYGQIWDFADILPLPPRSRPVSLNEGGTPVTFFPKMTRQFKVKKLYVKREELNPGGSLYDREMSVTLSAIQQEEFKTVFLESPGNLGISGGIYSKLANRSFSVIFPRGCSSQFLGECQLYGGQVKAVVWNKTQREKVKKEIQKRTKIFDISTAGFSYRIEGAKTLFLELFRQFGNRFPDVIIIPIAEGILPLAFWKVLWEGRQLGWFARNEVPKVWAVQSANCAPFARRSAPEESENSGWRETIAFDLFVPQPTNKKFVDRILNEQQWNTITVEENEILSTWRKTADIEGILLSPEGSAGIAALKQLIFTGEEEPDQTFLIINPSYGSRYIDAIGFIDEI